MAVETETTLHWSPAAGVILQLVSPEQALFAGQSQRAEFVAPTLAYLHSVPAAHPGARRLAA